MPLYEYVCQSCGRQFEELASASESDAPRTCPLCGTGTARRVLSAPVVRAGSGDLGGLGRAMAPSSGGGCGGGSGGFS